MPILTFPSSHYDGEGCMIVIAAVAVVKTRRQQIKIRLTLDGHDSGSERKQSCVIRRLLKRLDYKCQVLRRYCGQYTANLPKIRGVAGVGWVRGGIILDPLMSCSICLCIANHNVSVSVVRCPITYVIILMSCVVRIR